MSEEREPEPQLPREAARGLCPQCVHVRKIESSTGSMFWLCRLAKDDPRFPRYPPQPRMVCPGFSR